MTLHRMADQIEDRRHRDSRCPGRIDIVLSSRLKCVTCDDQVKLRIGVGGCLRRCRNRYSSDLRLELANIRAQRGARHWVINLNSRTGSNNLSGPTSKNRT